MNTKPSHHLASIAGLHCDLDAVQEKHIKSVMILTVLKNPPCLWIFCYRLHVSKSPKGRVPCWASAGSFPHNSSAHLAMYTITHDHTISAQHVLGVFCCDDYFAAIVILDWVGGCGPQLNLHANAASMIIHDPHEFRSWNKVIGILADLRQILLEYPLAG